MDDTACLHLVVDVYPHHNGVIVTKMPEKVDETAPSYKYERLSYEYAKMRTVDLKQKPFFIVDNGCHGFSRGGEYDYMFPIKLGAYVKHTTLSWNLELANIAYVIPTPPLLIDTVLWFPIPSKETENTIRFETFMKIKIAAEKEDWQNRVRRVWLPERSND
jgi:hypothetical protein